jgi:hypothetical protein
MKIRDAIGQEFTEGDVVVHVTRHGSSVNYERRVVAEVRNRGDAFGGGELRMDDSIRWAMGYNVIKLYGLSPEAMERVRAERDSE